MQNAYAQYALATCSLVTLEPFSLLLTKVGTIPIFRGTNLQCQQELTLLDLKTHGLCDGRVGTGLRRNCDTAQRDMAWIS